MKKHNLYTWMVMLLAFPIWMGCSSESDEYKGEQSIPTYNGPLTPVQISVQGVNEGNLTRAVEPKMIFSQPLNKNRDTGYDIVTTIEAIENPSTRANVPLNNMRYRLLAYRGAISTTNYAGQGDFETDNAGKATIVGDQLFLPAGEYSFVCYSYGNKEEIPVFDGTSTLLSVEQGDDFMSCIQKNITVEASPEGNFVLNNTFVRQCTRVLLEVSATGFPDNTISACAATMNTMNDNELKWDFKSSASLPNSGTSGNASFTWTTLDNDVVTSDSRIVLPISIRNLSIMLTELTIGGEVLDSTIVNIPNVLLNPSKEYKINMALDRDYIPVGGYKWAKGNIYKDANGFHFEMTQEAYHTGETGGSYFDWNTQDIGVGTYNQVNYNYDNDPCAGIAPKGTWQTPSKIEVNALIDAAKPEWENSGTWFGIAPNMVFLPANGLRSPDIPVSIQGEGSLVYYSLRDDSQAPYYYSAALNLLKGYAGVTDNVERTIGMPIRCVKIER